MCIYICLNLNIFKFKQILNGGRKCRYVVSCHITARQSYSCHITFKDIDKATYHKLAIMSVFLTRNM